MDVSNVMLEYLVNSAIEAGFDASHIRQIDKFAIFYFGHMIATKTINLEFSLVIFNCKSIDNLKPIDLLGHELVIGLFKQKLKEIEDREEF